MHDICLKVDQLRDKRGWSVYELSARSGVPAPTLRKWFNSNVLPTIPALKQVCEEAFGISLATFFAEGNLVEIGEREKVIYDAWCALDEGEKRSVEEIVKNYLKKR